MSGGPTIPFPKRQAEPGANEGPSFLTAQDLAERWHCHVESIYRLPPEALPFTRPLRGRQRLYRIEDVESRERSMREGRKKA